MPTTIRLNSIEQEYSSFEENQVLTHDHLNQLINYFESQDRLTRSCALGVGIICGFKVAFSEAKSIITIGEGCGLTTDGDLLNLPTRRAADGTPIPTTERAFHLYRDYSDQNVEYAHFRVNGNQIPLWELLDEAPADDDVTFEALTEFTASNNIELREMVVVAYLDNYAKSSNICTPLDCNNQGEQQVRKTRFLLIRRGDVKNFIREYDTVYSKYGSVSRDYFRLPRVAVRKVVINGNKSDSYQTLANAYTDAIAATRDQMLDAFKRLHTTFGKFLDPDSTINFNDWEAHFRQIFPLSYSFRVLPTHFQYIYSHHRDLATAYQELRTELYEVLVECLPNPTAFPRHLMLGRLVPIQPGTDIRLRHQFYPSPVNTEGDARLLNVRSLYLRLHRLMENFVNPLRVYQGLKVTPSCKSPAKLENRAIPYYYSPSTSLVENWNHQKTIRNQEYENLSYHALSYSKEADIVNPLQFDGNDCDFFRVEGHMGQSYRDVIDQLEKTRSEHGLNFDVIALRLGDRREEVDPEDYECHFEDLGMLLDAWNAEQRCLSANISSFFSGFSLKKPGLNVGYNFREIDKLAQFTTIGRSPRGPGDVLSPGGFTGSFRPGTNIGTGVFSGTVNTRPGTGFQVINTNLGAGNIFGPSTVLGSGINIGLLGDRNQFLGANILGAGTLGGTNAGVDLGTQVSGFDLGTLNQNFTNQTQYAFTRPENIVLTGIATGTANRPGELLFQDRTIEANLQVNEELVLVGNDVGNIFGTRIGVSAPEWRDGIINAVRERDDWGRLLDGIREGVRGEDEEFLLDLDGNVIKYPETLPEVIVEIPIGIISKVNALTKLQPNSILDVNADRIQKFKEASDQLCSEVNRAKRKFENAVKGHAFYQEQEYIQDYLLLLNQVALNCCAAEKLEILMEEIEKRKQMVLNMTSFSNFVGTHAGLEHKGGVSNGGTFVIVYKDEGEEKTNASSTASMKLLERVSFDFTAIKSTPVLTARTTLEPTLGLKVNPALLAYRKGESVDNFTKALEKKELTTTPANFAKFVVENHKVVNIDNTIRDYLKVNAISKRSSLAGLIRNGIFDQIRINRNKGFEPNVSRFSIIADFCLPYRMSTDCPPMAFVIQKTRVSLRLEINYACVEWETDDDGTNPRPVAQDPVEKYLFVVTPINGEIIAKVPAADGSGMAVIADPIIEVDDMKGIKFLVPSGLVLANYGKEINFTVNGQDTDSIVKIYEKPNPAFTIGDLTTTEEDDGTIVVEVPLQNDTVSHTDAEYTYLWDFGDGRTDESGVPDETLEYRFSLLELTGLPEIELRLSAFSGPCTGVTEPQVLPIDKFALLGVEEACLSLSQTRINDDLELMVAALEEEIFIPALAVREGIQGFYNDILQEEFLIIYLSGRINSKFLKTWAGFFLESSMEESVINDEKFQPLRRVRFLLIRLLLHVYFCQANLEMDDELTRILDIIREFVQLLREREMASEARTELSTFIRTYMDEMRVQDQDFRDRLEELMEFLEA